MCRQVAERGGAGSAVELAPKARVVAGLSVVAPVALSGFVLIALWPSLWWILTTYGWIAFPAIGLVTSGLAELRTPPPVKRIEAGPGRDLLRTSEGGLTLQSFVDAVRRRSGAAAAAGLTADARRELERLVGQGASFGWVVYDRPAPGAVGLPGGPGDAERAAEILVADPRASWYWCDSERIQELGYHEFEPRLEAWSLRRAEPRTIDRTDPA